MTFRRKNPEEVWPSTYAPASWALVLMQETKVWIQSASSYSSLSAKNGENKILI